MLLLVLPIVYSSLWWHPEHDLLSFIKKINFLNSCLVCITSLLPSIGKINIIKIYVIMYTDYKCLVEEPGCQTSACSGHGECVELKGNDVRCICDDGYTSDNCSFGKWKHVLDTLYLLYCRWVRLDDSVCNFALSLATIITHFIDYHYYLIK